VANFGERNPRGLKLMEILLFDSRPNEQIRGSGGHLGELRLRFAQSESPKAARQEACRGPKLYSGLMFAALITLA